jgi:hypothetical protein
MDRNEKGAVFFLDRAKTGRAAAGTLTPWSEKLLTDYLASLGAELLDNAPIFRTAGSEPGRAPMAAAALLDIEDGPRLSRDQEGCVRARGGAPVG